MGFSQSFGLVVFGLESSATLGGENVEIVKLNMELQAYVQLPVLLFTICDLGQDASGSQLLYLQNGTIAEENDAYKSAGKCTVLCGVVSPSGLFIRLWLILIWLR